MMIYLMSDCRRQRYTIVLLVRFNPYWLNVNWIPGSVAT